MADANPITSKKCSKCQVVKPCDQFYRRRNRSNGHMSWCKKCCLKNNQRKIARGKAATPLIPEVPGVNFKLIDGFPGYCVGDDGSVWSRKFGNVWRKLKLRTRRDRWVWIHLSRPGFKGKQVSVGRLVLTAFIGPCPPGMECCHDPDPDPTNCHLDNLRWDTHTENMRDSVRHGTLPKGERHHWAKLTEADIRQAAEMHANGVSWAQLGRNLGVKGRTVRQSVIGANWKHLRS